MKYKTKRGLPGNISAQVVGEYIEQIRKKSGSITPTMLVKKAKAKSSPIHNCFTWDDKKAGKLRRLDEARYLLRTIIIEIEAEEEPIITRAFVNISDDSEYTTVKAAMSNKELREQLLQQALIEFKAFRYKYSQLKELSGIFKAFDKI